MKGWNEEGAVKILASCWQEPSPFESNLEMAWHQDCDDDQNCPTWVEEYIAETICGHCKNEILAASCRGEGNSLMRGV